jgi:hypothetical protein
VALDRVDDLEHRLRGFEDLSERVDVLAARKITVADLPVRELILKFELLGLLDVNLAAWPGSVAAGLARDRAGQR